MVYVTLSPKILLLVLHKQNCVVLTQKQTNTNPMSFSTSQNPKTLVTICIPCSYHVCLGWHFGLLGAGGGHTELSSRAASPNTAVHSFARLRWHPQKARWGHHSLHLWKAASSIGSQHSALAARLPGICWPPPPLELPRKNTQSPVQNPLTAKNISNYNGYYIYLMTVCLQDFIRSYAYFMQRAASC